MKARRLPQEGIVLEVVVNLQEIIRGRIKGKLKEFIKKLIEGLLEEESKGKTGACRHERTVDRKGYRNGHYERDLVTRLGLVEELGFPGRM